ncbi:hypothetical protein [Ferruginibacter sp.]
MQLKHFLFGCISLTLCNCSGGFSKGVKKDLSTGLTSSYNGFAVDDIYLAVDDNKLSTNKIALGKKVELIADGVDYYQLKDGKVNPGCRIILTDKAGKEILNLPDAFAEQAALDKSKAASLKATLTTGSPMLAGETYHLNVQFFDKNKKESEIVSDVDLVMKE